MITIDELFNEVIKNDRAGVEKLEKSIDEEIDSLAKRLQRCKKLSLSIQVSTRNKRSVDQYICFNKLNNILLEFETNCNKWLNENYPDFYKENAPISEGKEK